MKKEDLLFARFENQARKNADNLKKFNDLNLYRSARTNSRLIRIDNFLKLTGPRGWIRATPNDMIAAGINVERGDEFKFWYLDTYGNILSI